MKNILQKTFYSFLLVMFFSSILYAQPLAGNYTINSLMATGGTNFQSFNDFATSINTNGISASVVATVEPGSGPYQEQVVFRSIPGTGAGSTVTIEGNGETITAATSTTQRHIVRLRECSFFTINNLSVRWDSTSTGGFYGIHLLNTGSDITITNCNIDISGTLSTLYGSIVASGDSASILETGDFHRVTIHGNTVTGGGYGVSVFGLVSNLASDIVISENTFYDFEDNGIYLRETSGAIIRDNHFDKRTNNVGGTNAIQIAQAANVNANIFNNYITVSQTSNGTQTIRGIYLFNGTGHKVYNNVIHDIRLTSGNFTGIEVRTGGIAPSIYFNTISIDNSSPTTGNLYGIKEELTNTNSMLRNNMISISQQTSGTKAGFVLASNSNVTTAFDSDYNNIYVPGGNCAMRASTTPTFYTSITDWSVASAQDANSLSLDPMFVSSANPVPANLALDNTGIALAGYTSDVLGNLRSATPDIGAFEFLGVGLKSISSMQNLVSYPNPVQDQLTLKLPEGSNSVVQISVYSVDGKVALEESQNVNASMKELQVNTANLIQGNYLLKITVGEKVYYSRFVKAWF
ncbi:MAG: T9SS type A sorting domain-containing protein [Bacteroidia bacterium]|nr:T9SS type A sorting domain-containing protein [Bacteroidia bacterium]